MRYFVAAEKKTEIFQLLLLLAAIAGGEFFFVCVNAWCFVSSARLHNLEKQKAMAHCLTKPFGFGFLFTLPVSVAVADFFYCIRKSLDLLSACTYLCTAIVFVFVFHLHFLRILLLCCCCYHWRYLFLLYVFQTYLYYFISCRFHFISKRKIFSSVSASEVNEKKMCKRAYSTGWNEEINI